MNYKEKELYEKQYRIWKIFLWVTGTICVVLFLYLCRFIGFAVHRYRLNTMLREATIQIAQLTSNIRVFYSVHNNEPIPSIQKMIEVGALPPSLFANNIIANPFGGQVIIQQGNPFQSKKNKIPTFKISYQGLSHEECVRLAVIDWGGSEQGLIAMAAGIANADGVDTALQDIDEDFSSQESVIKIGKNGKKQSIRAAVHYKLNVAKPDSSFLPTPFSEDAAHVACECEQYTNCSFALKYTLSGYKGS